MFAAPDIYASPAGLINLVPFLKKNARVVFFGAKLTRHPMEAILNPILRTLYKLSFSTTPGPDYEPWQAAAKYKGEIAIREYFFGLMFLASGTMRL